MFPWPKVTKPKTETLYLQDEDQTETMNPQDWDETEMFDFSKLSRPRCSNFKTETRPRRSKKTSRDCLKTGTFKTRLHPCSKQCIMLQCAHISNNLCLTTHLDRQQPRKWKVYMKLSYPQRKRASKVAILYGADGISIWNRMGTDHECDRQTVYVRLMTPSVESIQNAKFDIQHLGSVAVDSLQASGL